MFVLSQQTLSSSFFSSNSIKKRHFAFLSIQIRMLCKTAQFFDVRPGEASGDAGLLCLTLIRLNTCAKFFLFSPKKTSVFQNRISDFCCQRCLFHPEVIRIMAVVGIH